MKRPAPDHRGPPPIHVIGDSHSSVFTGLHGVCGTCTEFHQQALPGFDVWHLGQYLAYSVGSPRHQVHQHIRACLRRAGPGPVAFFFGEIDCRNHVVKHAATLPAIRRTAAQVAAAYARRCRTLAPSRAIAFVTIPPPTVTQHGNTQLPTVGSFTQRRAAVDAFNHALRAAARSVNAPVVDVHDALADRRGTPNPAYFADGVHADPRALPLFLREFVRLGWIDPASATIPVADALALVPPPPTSNAMLPGRLDDPRAARRILIERAALLCRAGGARRIALWGAGRHTRAMGTDAFTALGLRVVTILDDNAAPGDAISGVPVQRPGDFRGRVDAVVVSSDAHEHTLLRRAREHLAPVRTRIVPIYAWQEAAPAPTKPPATSRRRPARKG
ncbi:MAG: hypothetical protein U0637_10660 [Phycisphaerales bacterium]